MRDQVKLKYIVLWINWNMQTVYLKHEIHKTGKYTISGNQYCLRKVFEAVLWQINVGTCRTCSRINCFILDIGSNLE